LKYKANRAVSTFEATDTVRANHQNVTKAIVQSAFVNIKTFFLAFATVTVRTTSALKASDCVEAVCQHIAWRDIHSALIII
jgi:hypothetical protein